tara:strand:+ start:109 stop:747 length:639 start_codon:yes stop_codon:yes gene_type:complete
MTTIYIALDTTNIEKLTTLANVIPRNFHIKVGLELFIANPAVIGKLFTVNPLFLDLKLHDIPTTIEKTVTNLRKYLPKIVTVHSSGGHGMLKAAQHGFAGTSSSIAGVVNLSSMPIDKGKIHNRISRLIKAGIPYVILPPVKSVIVGVQEVYPELKIITPGIRPSWYVKEDDHVNVLSLEEAYKLNIDVVMGRPLLSLDPETMIRYIQEQKV